MTVFKKLILKKPKNEAGKSNLNCTFNNIFPSKLCNLKNITIWCYGKQGSDNLSKSQKDTARGSEFGTEAVCPPPKFRRCSEARRKCGLLLSIFECCLLPAHEDICLYFSKDTTAFILLNVEIKS